jgi:hypothetical protein
MRRFTIMGFTEAELGFVLAALFVAVAVTAVHERDASAATVGEQQIVADSMIAGMRAELHVVRDSVRVLRDSLATLENRISTKVPQCWERGEQSAPVAELAVIGADRFVMAGDTVTLAGVQERLASFIERGNALGCRFVVRARPTAGIDAVQQSNAVWQLRRFFDVNDRPR